MRDHSPVPIKKYKGLFKRGDIENTPLDHFTACNNIRFSDWSFLTRFGIGPEAPYKNVKRLRVFNQSLLILDIDGNIYHNDRPNRYIPILTIPGISDFWIAKFGVDRVLICPLGGDFLYVYRYGDTAGARKAAGLPPATAPTATVGPAGNVEQGVHVFAVVYETNSGFLTQLSPGVSIQLLDGTTRVTIGLPISPDAFVVARQVVATTSIDPADFTGNLEGYQFFFIPGARIPDNTTTAVDVNFYDSELLDDASHLEDLYAEIPAGGGVNTYHNRLVLWAPALGGLGNEHISKVLVSDPGEFEAINQIDGLIELERDGKGITHCQEYRDILHIFKQTKTIGCSDNGDIPSSWPKIIIDQGIGSQGNGVATIMDSGGVNIEFLLVADYTGLLMFDGKYNFPEISWKIKDDWPGSDIPSFAIIQVVVDSQNHFIYVAYPDGTIRVGDYNEGFNHDAIKWTPWSFNVKATTIVIIEEGGLRLVIGTKELQT